MDETAGGLKKTLASFDPDLVRVFLPFALRRPRYLKGLAGLARSFNRREPIRQRNIENGLQVPPFLILSVTSKCNLSCLGCYARRGVKNDVRRKPELDAGGWKDVISSARSLGVHGFVLAGGEPFLLDGLPGICNEFGDSLFIIMTNGTSVKDQHLRSLRGAGNTAVLVSVEGDRSMSDSRRGEGVHSRAVATVKRLTDAGVLTGICVTVDRENLRYWLDEMNLDKWIERGVRIASFIEYIPSSPIGAERGINDGHLLDPSERSAFRKFMLECRSKKPVYIIHSPGDEEFFGGCVSAGRGFAHVTPNGDLTPCPVSDIATHNLLADSLEDALASPLFAEIRKSEGLIRTEGYPCALFAHPKEVDELATRLGAYRSGSTPLDGTDGK